MGTVGRDVGSRSNTTLTSAKRVQMLSDPTGDCATTTSKVKDGSVTVNASRAGLDD